MCDTCVLLSFLKSFILIFIAVLTLFRYLYYQCCNDNVDIRISKIIVIISCALVFGVEPDLTREGGSIPVTLTFQEATGRNVMLLPVGSSDDGAHSQNEKLNRFVSVSSISLLLKCITNRNECRASIISMLKFRDGVNVRRGVVETLNHKLWSWFYFFIFRSNYIQGIKMLGAYFHEVSLLEWLDGVSLWQVSNTFVLSTRAINFVDLPSTVNGFVHTLLIIKDSFCFLCVVLFISWSHWIYLWCPCFTALFLMPLNPTIDVHVFKLVQVQNAKKIIKFSPDQLWPHLKATL